MEYKIPERNFAGIQFESLRRELDPKFNALHDDLCAAYHSNGVFQGWDFSKMSQDEAEEVFDNLHALVWFMYDVAFHWVNQASEQPIPEQEYNVSCRDRNGVVTAWKHSEAAAQIQRLQQEGLELEV